MQRTHRDRDGPSRRRRPVRLSRPPPGASTRRPIGWRRPAQDAAEIGAARPAHAFRPRSRLRAHSHRRRDFQERVPLSDYDAFWKDYWQPVFPQLADATWPGAVPYLALSSGTTSGSTKYIPMSPANAGLQSPRGRDQPGVVSSRVSRQATVHGPHVFSRRQHRLAATVPAGKPGIARVSGRRPQRHRGP